MITIISYYVINSNADVLKYLAKDTLQIVGIFKKLIHSPLLYEKVVIFITPVLQWLVSTNCDGKRRGSLVNLIKFLYKIMESWSF
jgi:hypothetical protein